MSPLRVDAFVDDPLDVAVVNGSYYDGEAIKLDYRSLDSPFLPYRPDLDVVRRVAAPRQVQLRPSTSHAIGFRAYLSGALAR
jgi:hypothetical protein